MNNIQLESYTTTERYSVHLFRRACARACGFVFAFIVFSFHHLSFTLRAHTAST